MIMIDELAHSCESTKQQNSFFGRVVTAKTATREWGFLWIQQQHDRKRVNGAASASLGWHPIS
jgi:hypothetical protein